MSTESEYPWKKLTGLRRLTFSFRVALSGIYRAISRQRNLRIHLCLAAVVVAFGGVLQVTRAEWMLLLACIGTVLSAELFNTAIEQLVDLACPEFDKRAGEIKDISAGAVLLICLTAAGIGVLILLPKVMLLLSLGQESELSG